MKRLSVFTYFSIVFGMVTFLNLWNNRTIIVSVPKKKGELFDCNNYRFISLINNIFKIFSKSVATRILSYGIENNYIRPIQFNFRNKEESSIFLFSISEICLRRHF